MNSVQNMISFKFFPGRRYFNDDGKSIYILSLLILLANKSYVRIKKDKVTDYSIGWKSKDLFESNHLPLHGAFLPNIKYIGYKIGMQFNNTSLVVEQRNYENNIVNAYILYDLDNWPNIPLRNLTRKNCLVN